MKLFLGILGAVSVWGLSAIGVIPSGLSWAQTDGEILIKDRDVTMVARLDGFQEVPAISTTGHGAFKARLIRGGKAVEYALAYTDLQGDVTQAHLHFGRTGTNGGVILFLCQTGDHQDPTGQAPRCNASGVVEGVLTETNIIGPAEQGIEPGAFREVVRAVLAQASYVNVHTTTFPRGEIRGQVGTSQLAIGN